MKLQLTSANSLQAICSAEPSLPVLRFFRHATGISLEIRLQVRGVVVESWGLAALSH